jgi:hypothetical protein
VAVKLRRIRLESDRALIGIRRRLEVPEPFQCLAEMVVGLCGLGAKLHDSPETVNRRLNLALGKVGTGEVV